ncbi:MAG TPA: tetratricopeptide repeat protein [Gammaproteobacteria bacterium]|nr:tetratricopeptide repeat protein [Gammaproteobacteria bacterium]
MISMRARATALGLVLVTAAFAAARLVAQELSEDPVSSVGRQIEEIESSQGINSPELIRPLTNFGLLLREQGDVDLAVAAFERARHIVRVNYGLTSFEEAPLLRQLVQIEEARGNAAAAWDLEQVLLGLIYRSPGPRPGAVSMLREIADKRADVLERYSVGEFPPQIELGCYYAGPLRRDGTETVPGSCRSGSSWTVKQALYDEATRYYYDAMDMIRFSEGPSSDDLPEIYMAVLRASYAARNDYGTENQGRDMLRAVYERHVKYAAPLPVQMNALLQMADWDLLHAGGRKKNESAFQAYEALYERFQQEDLEQSFIDEIFSPSVPVVLPAFSPSRLVSSETPDSSGYIDVAFEITKYGEGRSIEILGTSANTTDAVRLRLRDLIKWTRFRPRMAGGAFEDPSRVVVRYYVND